MEHQEVAAAAAAAAAVLDRVKQSNATSHRSFCLAGEAAPDSNASPEAIRDNKDHNNDAPHTPTTILPSSRITTDTEIPRVMRGIEDQSCGRPGQQSSASNDSQSTTDGHDFAPATTPPTSTSQGFSSQSSISHGQLSQLSQLSQLAAAQQPLSSIPQKRPSLASLWTTAGQKRTADGQVKAGSASSPESTQQNARGHSRNASAASTASSTRIGEMASELRARLSYAQYKVEAGWASKSIDEVESLASQAGSPISSNSTLHGRRNTVTSPRTAIANVQGYSRIVPPASQVPIGDFDLYSRSDPQSRTYESFWRDHPSHPVVPQRPSHPPFTSPPMAKSLGPPADIRPAATSRRSGTPKYSKPPTLPSQGSHSPYNTSAPRTPRRAEFGRGTGGLQAPSRTTLQEEEAMEALLFMSSPGNSGNMGHVFPQPRNQCSPQQSPLRAEFNIRGAQGRRVEFDATATSGSAGSSEAGGAEYRRKMRTKAMPVSKTRAEAIDRMLDESGDSSSDEDSVMITITSSRSRQQINRA